jgi:hypothetical protein
VAEDPDTDPVTGVLLNKLGLGTATGLESAEREITHAALILLGESPVHPGYDLPRVCAIHRRIFGDIYDWAGQIRTVGIAKGSLFCLPQHIETSAAEIFRALGSENCQHYGAANAPMDMRASAQSALPALPPGETDPRLAPRPDRARRPDLDPAARPHLRHPTPIRSDQPPDPGAEAVRQHAPTGRAAGRVIVPVMHHSEHQPEHQAEGSAG